MADIEQVRGRKRVAGKPPAKTGAETPPTLPVKIVIEDGRQVLLTTQRGEIAIDASDLMGLANEPPLSGVVLYGHSAAKRRKKSDLLKALKQDQGGLIEVIVINKEGVARGRDTDSHAVPDEVLSLGEFIEAAAQALVASKMPSDTREYFQSLGPWVAGQSVKETLGVTWETLSSWRAENKLLGVKFADGKFYYPKQQFLDGVLIREMKDILDVLEPAYSAPETMLAWFAGQAREGDPATRWDLLHRGDHQTLLGWAEEDAARILS